MKETDGLERTNEKPQALELKEAFSAEYDAGEGTHQGLEGHAKNAEEAFSVTLSESQTELAPAPLETANPEHQSQATEYGYEVVADSNAEGLESAASDYNKCMKTAKIHADKAKEWKRKADNLESDMRRGKISEAKRVSAQNDVEKFRAKARQEEREAEKYRQAARKAMRDSLTAEDSLNSSNMLENASVSVCRRSQTPQYYP